MFATFNWVSKLISHAIGESEKEHNKHLLVHFSKDSAEPDQGHPRPPPPPQKCWGSPLPNYLNHKWF